MKIFEYACLVLVLSARCAVAARHNQLRVYQGTEDLLNEFPFIVVLDLKLTARICTGSLISDSWVITAGHCLHSFCTKDITTRYADFTVKPNETKAYVKTVEIHLHPSYREHKALVKNDIALILTELTPSMSFAKLSAVDYKSLLGLPAKYAGFGATTKKRENLSELLKKDKFKPLQVGEGVVTACPPRQYSGWLPSICIAPKCSSKKQMPYLGDSGGPLICNGKIVAVVSGLRKDWSPITMFTPVSPHLNWIRDLTQTLGKNETKGLVYRLHK